MFSPTQLIPRLITFAMVVGLSHVHIKQGVFYSLFFSIIDLNYRFFLKAFDLSHSWTSLRPRFPTFPSTYKFLV